jgi:ureidoglycolate hydrolase
MNVKVAELSKEIYAPFGQFVGSPTHTPTIQDDIVRYWAGLAGFEVDGTIDVGWVTMRKRPMLLSQLERHLHTVEVAIPLDDVMVLPVALGREPLNYDSKPRPEDIRGFYLRPGQMVTYAPGTWHFGGFPLNKPEASFMVLTRRGTADTDVSMQSISGISQVEFIL